MKIYIYICQDCDDEWESGEPEDECRSCSDGGDAVVVKVLGVSLE